MGKTARLLAAVAGLLLLAPAALADIGPPVKVRLLGEPRAARPGEPFSGRLEITSGKPATLAGLRLEGQGWSGVSLVAPAQVELAKSDRLEVAFTAVPDQVVKPLVLRFTYDGVPVRKELDLSEEHLERMTLGGRAVPAPGSVKVPPPPGPHLRLPEPVTGQAPSTLEPEDAPTAKGRNIRVTGRFVYNRTPRNDWHGADGVTVRIMDEDPGFDDTLYHGIVQTDGSFDVTVWWDQSLEGDPDLYVQFETLNSEVEVEDSTWEINYRWNTGTWNEYGGSYLAVGDQTPDDESEYAALHITSSITRTWRWLLNEEGYDPDHVDVQWPDDGTGVSYYNAYWEEIHITTGSSFDEGNHCHEYGHHWMHHYATTESPDYCNGICDDGDCGHCTWCPENGYVAVSEGWSEWWQAFFPAHFAVTYGLTPRTFGFDLETLQQCADISGYGNPLLTEGMLAALLWDISDTAQDLDPAFTSAERDSLASRTHELFQVYDLDQPTSPAAFLTAFKARYPGLGEPFWKTARNNGYEVDTDPPGIPGGFTSLSHAIGTPSADPTVELVWTRPSDDASGAGGYSFLISTGAPQMPPATMSFDDRVYHETGNLPPGTFYFSLRAVDKAGHWSNGYASFGPVVIRQATPANLTSHAAVGWSYPLVPRDDDEATPNAVFLPPTLPGYDLATYWNLRGINDGEASTVVAFRADLYVDGARYDTTSWSPVAGDGQFVALNEGPVWVDGGRHTFEVRLDAGEVVAESDETDNRWAHQFIWTPAVLAPNVFDVRTAPPDRFAGWESVVDGSPLWYNCHGLRFSSSGAWNAVLVYAANDTLDYDCALLPPSSGASDGFDSGYVGYSARLEGCLDAVIVNGNVMGVQDWDVGVINYSGDAGLAETDYVVEHVTNLGISCGDSISYAWQEEDYLDFYEVLVAGAWLGGLSIDVTVDAEDGPVQVAWYDDAFAAGGLLNCSAHAVSDAAGRARLDLEVSQSGYYGLAIFRDHRDGGQPTQLTIEIQKTPPDPAPFQPDGWYAPLVPRAATDGTPVSVPPPDLLAGNAAATYLNAAAFNASPTAGELVDVRFEVDSLPLLGTRFPTLGPYHPGFLNNQGPVTIRGGRHTLTMSLDPGQVLEELDESNNLHGQQYVWTPWEGPIPSQAVRSAPPPRLGGWETIPIGQPMFYNCDGLRLLPPESGWVGLAVMPGDTSDVDLRLHAPMGGALEGFDLGLRFSGWGVGASDFILLNYDVMAPEPFDFGALRWRGEQPYSLQMLAGQPYPGEPGVPTEPLQMGAGEILQLWTRYFEPTPVVVRLENLGGALDWGISLHPAYEAAPTKSMVEEGGIAWQNGPGQDEQFVVHLIDPGVYCLAVWKTGAADLSADGTYRLHLDLTDVGVPPDDAPPPATALRTVHPNPFNPSLTIGFDLATPGTVTLTVHDLRGARVRTLAAGTWPAGRHQVLWDGDDDRGQRAASGVYLLRLSAGGEHWLRKVVMTK